MFENVAEKFFIVVCVCMFFGFIYCFLGVIDKLDQYDETGTIIAIERLDRQILKIETTDGNIWEYGVDYDTPCDIGDEVVVTFKEYENANVYDDSIVKVKWVE